MLQIFYYFAIMISARANLNLLPVIGKDLCLRAKIYPIDGDEQQITLACLKHDELLLELLHLKLGIGVDLQPVPENILEEELKRISENQNKSAASSALGDLQETDNAIADENNLDEVRKKSQSEPIVKLVNEIVDQGVTEGATDIHIEPAESQVRVRFRKDGLLRKSLDLPKWVQAPLVSRIKVLAELDIAEKRLPQDGRIKWSHRSEVLDMRISTLPTRLGEKVVLRLLKHSLYVSTLDSLGMPESIYTPIRHIINKPQGMFFVTGPTGSGKTSTLYAALGEILHKEINISTIEDPIEYRLNGANQVQVHEKAGLTFAQALRSLLRQDPDVILVGEIRDEETASIAIQAAQTGHLVFSTLHTNDAASAVTRLLDLKVKPFLISSSVLGVLAQRLLRKVCKECFTWEPASAEHIALIPGLPDKVPHAQGCVHCGHSGYSGRTGIFEILLFSPAIREAVSSGQTEQKIRDLGGLKPLAHDGLDKIIQGLTTPEELLRVAMVEEKHV